MASDRCDCLPGHGERQEPVWRRSGRGADRLPDPSPLRDCPYPHRFRCSPAAHLASRCPSVSGLADPQRGVGGTDSPERLSLLCVSQVPPSPPRFGAQARIHGLMTQIARRHELSALCLVDEGTDLEDCRRAMQSYCRDVILIRNPKGSQGLAKRSLQLRSLASLHSFERHLYSVAGVQEEVTRLLRQRRFDVVNLEFPYLGHLRLRQSPKGVRPPLLVIDAHEIAHDMVRQFARSGGVSRRLYAG